MNAAIRKSLVVLALALSACGKRGDPHPPLPIIPKATSDLVVTQRGPKVILVWSYPSLTTAGKSLPKIRRVVVFRSVEEAPPPAATPAPATAAAQAKPAAPETAAKPAVPETPAGAFAKMPPLTPVRFTKMRTRVDALESATIPGATIGARLVYQDSPPLHAQDGRAIRLTYAVVTEGESARSDLSNLAAVVPLDVATAPAGLTATAKPEGVVLTWSAPEKSISGATPSIIGYNIYRNADAQTLDELAAPVNAAPVGATTYTDVPPYATHQYRVTAVSSPMPSRSESEPSSPAGATFKDLLPPPPPATLTALVETKAVRLVWDPVDAPDLLGYKIYRREGTANLALTPYTIPQTNFSDSSIDIGIEYVYTVTSVDKSGNESAPTSSGKVLVPKTP
ncbi:MAG TPA: hypothetical protein VEZ11_09250 [Thermoanaerobaculia bacterium]|nr:hypothetical protein [Thermoanaerobaculia bacterium]